MGEVRIDDVERLVAAAGFPDTRWIDGSEIVVAHWVRMKCTYACDEYGQQACCPPNVPTVQDCAAFFRDYLRVAVIHIEQAGLSYPDLQVWKKEVNSKLLELERVVFLAGYHKALVLYPGDCSMCPDCVARREDCRHLESSRPTPEALAVDVFATARKLGYPIRVLTDRSQMMDRYAFLLVE
jgi:predicted metal-binding protein